MQPLMKFPFVGFSLLDYKTCSNPVRDDSNRQKKIDHFDVSHNRVSQEAVRAGILRKVSFGEIQFPNGATPNTSFQHRNSRLALNPVYEALKVHGDVSLAYVMVQTICEYFYQFQTIKQRKLGQVSQGGRILLQPQVPRSSRTEGFRSGVD